MIIGIIKNGNRIIGHCSVQEIEISYNKVKTIVCNEISASSKDRIIFICKTCNKEKDVNKRNFCENNNFDSLCSKCRTKKTSREKYGWESPNQFAAIKEKQHRSDIKRSKPFESGNNHKRRITSSMEELCELRSNNAKKNWKNGRYDNSSVAFSKASELRWKNPEYRKNQKTATQTPEAKRRKSENGKKLWKEKRDIMLHALRKGLSCKLSKIHKLVKENLKLESKGFLSEQIVGDFIVDELNKEKKIIIEINGDYVHANPRKYKEFDIIRLANSKYTAKEKWEYDKKRKEYLESLGYRVIIIWEEDFKKFIDANDFQLLNNLI